MLILLPPSEGKAVGSRGAPLDLGSLSFPALTDARSRTIDALAAASSRSDALEVLDAPKGAADRVAANTELRTAPTLRASALYTGVLYDALGLDSLSTAAKRRAARRVVVVSALFGALRPTDRVPSYRLSMGVDLPGIGPLAPHWRSVLDDVLAPAAGRGTIVDMRSSTYVAAWRPKDDLADRTVAVHVVRDADGHKTAVSHMAKHTRGLVARHLLEVGADPRTTDDLAEVVAGGFRVELLRAKSGTPDRLEVVEPD